MYTFDYNGRPIYLGARSSARALGPQRDEGRQQTIPGGMVTAINAVDDATQIDLFVERGLVRVRSDEVNPTNSSGEPMWAGDSRGWHANSLRVLAVGNDAVVTSISR